MAEEECLICGEKAPGDELSCKLCACHIHFVCAFGAPVKRNKPDFRNGRYTCPVCVVSKDNKLILKAVCNNQRYIAEKSRIIEFKVPDSFFGPKSVEKEVSSVNVHVNTDDDTEVREAPDVSALNLHPDSRDDNGTSGIIGTPPPRVSQDYCSDQHGHTPVNSGNSSRHTSRNRRHSRRTQSTSSTNETLSDHFGELAPPHSADIARSGRLSFMLKVLKNLPSHVTTVLLGGSNEHHIKAKEVDPKHNAVAVRSSGGLCVVAAVLALQKYRNLPYQKIKNLVWSLGTNDALHGAEEHCPDDYPKYVELLYTESKRIFPNAIINFLLPFTAIKDVKADFRKDLIALLKEKCPQVKIHHPPSMRNMMARDGVHISEAGRSTYTDFLMSRFTTCKPGQIHSGELPPRQTSNTTKLRGTPSEDINSTSAMPEIPIRNNVYQPTAGHAPLGYIPYQCPPQGPVPYTVPHGPTPYQVQTRAHTGLAREILDEVRRIMQPSWPVPQQQVNPNPIQLQWPPLTNFRY